ncbi:MAG TPA: hypothetical protein EYG89_04125 [Bacteroidia bacterium]|nr:hypothetical protein [Bacteroidia bacterium]
MDGHIFIQRKGDVKVINEYREVLKHLSLDELITNYNGTEKLGFLGSHQQARHIIAIHQEFLRRISQSPIKIENNILISFKGEIKTIINNKINYERH